MDKIKIELCHDHFERLCKDQVCDECPSKAEHKDVIMALAAVRGSEEEKVHGALLSEIRSIRRSVNLITDTTNVLKRSIDGDGNGNKGLKTRVLLMERDFVQLINEMKEDRKRNENRLGHWISGVSALIACIISAASLFFAMATK